jgi:hypothetical protein
MTSPLEPKQVVDEDYECLAKVQHAAILVDSEVLHRGGAGDSPLR